MNDDFLFLLGLLNVLFAVINYTNKNYKVAMFSSFASGFVFSNLI